MEKLRDAAGAGGRKESSVSASGKMGCVTAAALPKMSANGALCQEKERQETEIDEDKEEKDDYM